MWVLNYYIVIMISIHAAREGGDPEVRIADHIGKISIHAAREGGDCVGIKLLYCYYDFNPRRP